MTRKRFISPAGLGETIMKSSVIKRSIAFAGHKTSVGLEDAFWNGLKEIAKWRDETLSNLIASINADRQHANLSSAIRLYVLDFYRDQYEAGDPSIRQSPTVSHSTISRL
jgi:predicted DNA-binding ribbon-helix-helix protein